MKDDYPWLKKYPEGVSKEINPDKYASLLELLNESFSKFKDLPAFDCMGKSISYSEVERLSKDFAKFLQNYAGLQKGDKVVIQLPNLLQYPIVMFGIIRAGMVVVNTNPLYTEREMEQQFKDSGAKAIIILSNFASKLESILKNTDIKTIITTQIGDMLDFPKSLIVNKVVKYVKRMIPAYNLSSAISLKTAIAYGGNSTYQEPKITSSDIAFLQYTGGTTGVSKGVMLTHRNVISNILQTGTWMSIILKEQQEVVMTPLPLYHIFSLTINCFCMLMIGARNILIPNPRDLKGFIKELKKYKFSVFTGVNTLFNGLLNHPDFDSIDFSSLKVCIGGGMAVQKKVAEEWHKRTGCKLLEGYGLTETSPVLCCNPLNGNDRIGYIGIPYPNTEVKVVDDDGNELPIGEKGEIVAKGPQVMKGYWQKPDETDKVFFSGGWFKTGDIAIMAEDGFFQIVDRKKDMILVSGFNVYPNEIENIVVQHPKVLEAAAVGVPHPNSRECVKLFVVKKNHSLTQDELKTYCKENLVAYKVPKYYEFRDNLPKTNVGKILKRKLKEV